MVGRQANFDAVHDAYRGHLIEVRSLFSITSRCFHPVQRPENITISSPSLRSLDGKACGQTLTGLVAFSPTEAGH